MDRLRNIWEIKRVQIVMISIAMIELTFLLGFSLSSNVLFPRTPQLDDSVFRYVGMVMQDGGVPYKDTFDHKGPLIYLINYLGLFLGENGIWFFELIGLSFTVLFTYKTIRLFVNSAASMIGTCIVLFQLYDYLGGGNYTEEYALPFIVCAIYIFTDYFLNGKTTRIKLGVCGACFMAVMLLRANMIAIWIVFAIAVLISEICNRSSKWIKYLLYFVLGTMIFLAPFVLYFGINGALGDFWEDYIIFNLSYTGTSIVNKWEAIRGFLWSSPCAIAVIISGIRVITKKENIKIDVINLIYAAVCIYMTGMGGRTYNHYGIVLIPLTIIPAARVIQYVSENGIKKHLIIGAVIALIIMCWPWFNQSSNKAVSTVRPEQSLEGIIATFIKENTSEDDLIIQCGHKDIFYVLSDRMAASKYSYPLPIAQIKNDVYDEFFDDLEENKPVVVITDTWDEQHQLDYTEFDRRLELFLDEHKYVEGSKLETYTLYYAPDSKLANSRVMK